MEHFTPVSASIGGVLIGLSATMLWLADGRIAGISGIVGSLWSPRTGDVAWRVAFLIGLIASPALYRLAGVVLPKITIPAPSVIIIAGGLLVGFGTCLGGPLHERTWRLRVGPALAALTVRVRGCTYCPGAPVGKPSGRCSLN